MNDEIDDATRVTRPVDDGEATVVSRGVAEEPDDRTVVTRPAAEADPAAEEPDDRTLVTRPSAEPDDRTVVSRPSNEPDDRTIVSAPRAGSDLDDATLVVRDRDPHSDNTSTVVGAPVAGGRRPSAAAPGRLSGGRVAVVPEQGTTSYGIRTTVDQAPVVRTVIAPPTVPSRPSRATVGATASPGRSSARRSLGVILVVVGATLLTAAIVVGIVLFLLLS